MIAETANLETTTNGIYTSLHVIKNELKMKYTCINVQCNYNVNKWDKDVGKTVLVVNKLKILNI